MINFDFDFYEIVVWVATIAMCLIATASRSFPLKAQGGLGQPLPNPIAVVFPVVFYVCFSGLRKTIGDTYYYMYSFTLLSDENEVDISRAFNGELFSVLQNFIRNCTDDPQVLIFVAAAISLVAALVVLYLYSSPFDLTLFLFVAYGYLGGSMDGMRQYMAAGILACGTRFLFSKKRGAFLKYAVFVLAAYCMHISALIMLPIFFVVRRKAWKKSSYILIFLSVVAVLGFDTFLPSFLGALENTNYSGYATNGWFTDGVESGSNILRAAVAAAPIVVAYLNKERMKMLGFIGDILINLAFINVAINIIALYNWIFARFAIYLMLYYIIFTAWVVNYAVKPRERAVYVTGTVILYFLYSRGIAYQINMYQSDYFLPGRKLFR